MSLYRAVHISEGTLHNPARTSIVQRNYQVIKFLPSEFGSCLHCPKIKFNCCQLPINGMKILLICQFVQDLTVFYYIKFCKISSHNRESEMNECILCRIDSSYFTYTNRTKSCFPAFRYLCYTLRNERYLWSQSNNHSRTCHLFFTLFKVGITNKLNFLQLGC